MKDVADVITPGVDDPLLPQPPELTDATLAQLKQDRASASRLYHNILACLLPHVSLILIYAVLAFVYSRHYEHALAMDTDKFSITWFPLIVSTITQTFGTVS